MKTNSVGLSEVFLKAILVSIKYRLLFALSYFRVILWDLQKLLHDATSQLARSKNYETTKEKEKKTPKWRTGIYISDFWFAFSIYISFGLMLSSPIKLKICTKNTHTQTSITCTIFFPSASIIYLWEQSSLLLFV